MKKINIRKPKYIIPIIALPPLLFIGYQVCSLMNFSVKDSKKEVVVEDVNTDLPDANLNKLQIKSKYQSMLDNYGKATDYTGVDNIEKEEEAQADIASSYNEEEMRQVDSLNMIRENGRKKLEEQIAENNRRASEERVNVPTEGIHDNPEMDKMAEQMRLIQKMANGERILTKEEEEKARRQAEIARIKKEVADSLMALNTPVEVNKVGRAGRNHFNSIENGSSDQNLIRARVDELVKVKSGSRLRIRLSDDIEIKGEIIPKGTYLYANVTGFSAQRVKAKIESMMIGGKITPVDLNIYDLDCQEGFFVPSSAFREMSRDIGAGAMNMNVNMNSSGSQSVESVALQTLQQAFQSTTSAISKNIRKNKATVKYNTEVYLVSKK